MLYKMLPELFNLHFKKIREQLCEQNVFSKLPTHV